jgi:hypothetical protein
MLAAAYRTLSPEVNILKQLRTRDGRGDVRSVLPAQPRPTKAKFAQRLCLEVIRKLLQWSRS